MRPATTLALFAAAALMAVPVRAQDMDFTGQRSVWANGPGLECRETTHPTYGYAAPSADAPRVITFNRLVLTWRTLGAALGPAGGVSRALSAATSQLKPAAGHLPPPPV